MVNKRGNENAQLSKEDYDDLERRPGDNAAPAGDCFRASEETLKKRRIVRISSNRKWKSAATAPPRSNPFAGISLAVPPATFPTRATPSVTFPTSAAPSMTLPVAKDKLATATKEECQAFLQKMGKSLKEQPFKDWSQDFRGFLDLVKERRAKAKESVPSIPAPSIPVPSIPAPLIRTPSIPAPSIPAPSITFNFTGGSSAAPITPKPFSFAIPPPSDASKPIIGVFTKEEPAQIPTKTTEESKTESLPEDKVPEAKDSNTNEDCLLEIRAKKFKLVGEEWKDLGGGVVRLLQHKTKPSLKRILMRNQIGKVQLNVAVGEKMKFERILKAKTGFVRFVAKEEGSDNVSSLMIKTTKTDIDPLYNHLVEMAA